MALSSIQNAAQRVCRDLGLSHSLALVEQAWQSEMGGWGGVAEIAAIERSTLVVEVRSPVAMQEITLRRRELVRRLNRHFEDPFIQNISIRMAQRNGH